MTSGTLIACSVLSSADLNFFSPENIHDENMHSILGFTLILSIAYDVGYIYLTMAWSSSPSTISIDIILAVEAECCYDQPQLGEDSLYHREKQETLFR